MKLVLGLLAMGLIVFFSPSVYAGEGHNAGREWAEQHDIDDPDYNNGNSESFNEGVREYVEEQEEAKQEEADLEEDTQAEDDQAQEEDQ